MAVDIQTLVGLVGVFFTALSAIVTLLSWLGKGPTDLVQKIRPIALVILIFAAGYVARMLVAPYVFLASYSALDKTSISLNSIPLLAGAYGGKDDPDVRQGSAALSIKHGTDGKANYRLTYDLPIEGKGYAGLAFVFDESQDLKDYAWIDTTITFEDKRTLCRLVLKNTAGETAYADLGETVSAGKDISSIRYGNTHTIRIPLHTNFNINRQSIKEIGFIADTYFTRESHTFIVHDVRLIKH